MKATNLLYIALLLLTVSCKKNFLDKAPSVNLPEEKVFSDPKLASQYADDAYNYLVNDYARFNDHRGITGQAADEAVSSNNDVSIRTLNSGAFHDHYERGGEGLNDIKDVWDRSYTGIRITNKMLEKISSVPWTSSYSPSRIEGEMHFVRAFLYFELVKRFGGVVLIDKAYGANDNMDFPRNTYQECVDFILKDLEAAKTMLPPDYGTSDYGRATQGAAMALKARVLLYAASKLNNESGDIEKWKLAAAAANDVINLNKYSLQDEYSTLLNVAQSPEYIMIKIRAPRSKTGMIIDFVMSPGYGGAQGTLNPTQNHVDLYEMKPTGRSVKDALSGYDPQNPYVGRDPRFYANILYNQATLAGQKAEMWAGGNDYKESNVTYTATRYYCRKYWPDAYYKNSTGTALVNYIYFRYGEVLLNYAEAMNEAYGPDNVPSATYTLTARQALNLIRSRPSVSMPPLQSTNSAGAGYVAPGADAMRARIRNERAVELAFEDHRWYDIMRWKVGPEIVAQPVYGMNVIKNANGTFTYNPILLPASYQKVFRDYMHRYPIPRSEVYKSKNILKQNPGWE